MSSSLTRPSNASPSDAISSKSPRTCWFEGLPWSVWWTILAFFAIALLLYRWIDVEQYNHDEHQFIAPALLWLHQDVLPYRDYPYFHTPLQTMLFLGIFPFVDNPYFTVRLINAMAGLATAILIYRFAKHCMGDRLTRQPQLVASACTAAFVFAIFLPRAMTIAWNHALSTLAAVGCFMILEWALRKQKLWAVLVAGVLAGLAVGIRLPWATIGAPLGLALLLYRAEPLDWRRILPRVVCFTLGGIIALVPVVMLAIPNWEAFLFGNFGYPAVHSDYRNDTDPFHLPYLLRLPASLLVWFGLGTAAALLLIGPLVGIYRSRGRPRFPDPDHAEPRLHFAIATLAFVMLGAYAGTSLNSQYQYAPIAFTTLAAPAALAYLFHRGGDWKLWSRYVFSCLVIAGLTLTVQSAARMPSLLGISTRGTDKTHHALELSKSIRSLVPEGGRVVTFGPMVPLLAGVRTDSRFAVGPFAYRVASHVDPVSRAKYGIVGPDEINAYLSTDPPSAILTGFSRKLDPALVAWAEANHYQRIELPNRMCNAVLFRRIDANEASDNDSIESVDTLIGVGTEVDPNALPHPDSLLKNSKASWLRFRLSRIRPPEPPVMRSSGTRSPPGPTEGLELFSRHRISLCPLSPRQRLGISSFLFPPRLDDLDPPDPHRFSPSTLFRPLFRSFSLSFLQLSLKGNSY